MKLPLKWQFPGGKVDYGEFFEECLRREMVEELGIQVGIEKSLSATTHDYPISNLPPSQIPSQVHLLRKIYQEWLLRRVDTCIFKSGWDLYLPSQNWSYLRCKECSLN